MHSGIKGKRIAQNLALVISLIPFIVNGCARLRIEELNPSLIFSTKVLQPGEENPGGKIQIRVNERVPHNLPVLPITDGNSFYISDPTGHTVNVLNSSGDVIKIIGKPETPLPDQIRQVRVNLGVPGWIALDGNGNLFIQSRNVAEPEKKGPQLPPQRDKPYEQRDVMQLSNLTSAPSTIVQISAADEVVRTIGPEGIDGGHFESILRMDADESGHLYVLHAVNDAKVLSVYRDGVLIHRLEGFKPAEEDAKKMLHFEVEDIVPFPGGREALISVTFHRKSNYEFQYRKIYRIFYDKSRLEEIVWLDNAEDYFTWIHPDGGFYLQNVDEEGSRILYKIYSPEGEYLNNLQINLFGLRSGWREIYMTLEGKIYAARLIRDTYEIYEWK
jgi:hypothetical protein